MLYLCAFALQLAQVLPPQANLALTTSDTDEDLSGYLRGRFRSFVGTAVAICALLAHFNLSWGQLISDEGLDFRLMPISLAILFIINLIVIIGSLRQPLKNLFLLLFPATVTMIVVSIFFNDDSHSGKALTLGLGFHVLLSIVAYSLMTIAALEALFLAYQNHQLHQHQTGGLLRVLPPMQTMEALMFSLVATGFVLLTLALVTGFIFVEDFFAQHLAHKTVFSLVAWLVYATLLWGRFKLGWRGKTAALWTLAGFIALMLAFWGSKFVLEVLLVAP